MIRSMTAFATSAGTSGTRAWAWELRGVNGRGLDLRLRLPEGVDGLEQAARAALTARLSRGSVSVNLRLAREGEGTGAVVDAAGLNAAIAALGVIETRAKEAGLAISPASAADIFALRGVMVETAATEQEGLLPELLAGLDRAIDAFVAMREEEGRALASVILAQLDRISALTAEARDLADARRDETRAQMQAALRHMLDEAQGMDETRLAQELALIAVRTDVTEELDRLGAHTAAARDLLGQGGAVGRRLDFLAQEFNREANTLCSKSQSTPLTRAGLDLKATIDQMREQIQNVE